MFDFFYLGNYGGYIWSSYILSAVLLGGLSWFIYRRNKRAHLQLKAALQKTKSEL